jgi:hypothetical protein
LASLSSFEVPGVLHCVGITPASTSVVTGPPYLCLLNLSWVFLGRIFVTGFRSYLDN